MNDKLPQERRWQGFGLGGPAFADPQVVERCAYCDFAVSAPVEQALEAFEQHVCERPKPTKSLGR